MENTQLNNMKLSVFFTWFLEYVSANWLMILVCAVFYVHQSFQIVTIKRDLETCKENQQIQETIEKNTAVLERIETAITQIR